MALDVAMKDTFAKISESMIADMKAYMAADSSFSYKVAATSGAAQEYERFAREYGLTEREVTAFVRANDSGVPFPVLAEILDAAPVPRTTQPTARRLEDEARLVAQLEKVAAERAPRPVPVWQITCKCPMCTNGGEALMYAIKLADTPITWAMGATTS